MMKNWISVVAAAALTALGACDETLPAGTYTGYVEAELVMVAPSQSGWLIESAMVEGARVEPDMVLARLDAELQTAQVEEAQSRITQAQEQLREARAALDFASAERSRARNLVKRGVAAEARIDKAEADYKAAMARLKTAEENVSSSDPDQGSHDGAAYAQLAQARWQLDQRTITARRTGRVEEVYIRRGEFVTAGAPMASLLPDDGLKVRFFVPQSQLTAIKHGAPVLVSHDGDEAALTALISYIAREAEFTPPVIYSEGSREPLVFMVEARFSQPVPLNPGLPVTVRLP